VSDADGRQLGSSKDKEDKLTARLPEHINTLSSKRGFPRSAAYDQAWMFDHSMGPNPLWLAEWLCRGMKLSADMTVLDLGCGKALSSIFLAREFGSTVFANDLWISPEENLARIREASLQSRILPVHAEAHSLPYAKGFFDAIVAIDSYQYFGTDDLYLQYLAPFLKTGGQLALVMPGWMRDPQGPVSYMYLGFHTLEWWRTHILESQLFDIEVCDVLPESQAVWLESARAMLEVKRILRSQDGTTPEKMQEELAFWQHDIDFLQEAAPDTFALIRLVARRKQTPSLFESR
jgi:cyclopropane fatty-acyl-phospholipid synthase-like methyltransferase